MSNVKGIVHFVGAGPGDPELLTIKAHRLIQAADVIVYDRLVSSEIVAMFPPGATRTYVGKSPSNHHMSQDEINALLVRLAQSQRCIIRLKGGDPFVFGRGSEEASYLRRHGVKFAVVPGITSASACGAYAGIPLTHRGVASGVRIVTGHCRANLPLDLNWESLADPDTTLVIYMGLAHLEEISARLIQAGLPADTPAAAIENGTTPRQRRCISTLAQLPGETKQRGYEAPALIIIGRVVSLNAELDWLQKQAMGQAGEPDAEVFIQAQVQA